MTLLSTTLRRLIHTGIPGMMNTEQSPQNFPTTKVKARRLAQGPEEMCLSLEHQNPSKTSEKTGYFDHVTVSLHIL